MAINRSDVEAVAVSEVERVLHDLADSIDRYSTLVDRLYGRMAPILNSSPAAGSLIPPTKSYSAPLCQQIEELHTRINSTTETLNDLYERIEL